MHNHTNTRRGFTLIELLVGVLIIGILAAVALPQYQKVKARMTWIKLVPKMDYYIKQQQLYKLRNGVYAKQLAQLDLDAKQYTGYLRMDSQTYSYYEPFGAGCFQYYIAWPTKNAPLKVYCAVYPYHRNVEYYRRICQAASHSLTSEKKIGVWDAYRVQ